MEVGATSHGLTGAVSPFGKVTSLRPLRRLIWIGTDKVSLPSLVCRMSGSPAFWMRMSLMPVLPLVARPAHLAALRQPARLHLGWHLRLGWSDAWRVRAPSDGR